MERTTQQMGQTGQIGQTTNQPQPKYITVNGMLQRNPAYRNPANPTSQIDQVNPGSQNVAQTLPILSSMDDVLDATALLKKEHKDLLVPSQTGDAIRRFQEPNYLAEINAPAGSVPVDELTGIFAKYEIPLGMITKLLGLKKYQLHFLIDDSGSMQQKSKALMSEAHPETQRIHDPSGKRRYGDTLTRFEEAEDRLYKIIEILAFIPNKGIKISFLNRPDCINITPGQLTPLNFTAYTNQLVAQAFTKQADGYTPLLHHLRNAFAEPNPTMHYLFTDGLPSDCSIDTVKNLVIERSIPENHPITFISCSNDNLQWMKDADELAMYSAEIDDFDAERKEVCDKQGNYFPFNRGFWLLCQLVAAICPQDLDALDEDKPLLRDALSQVMGYEITPEAYRVYFAQHPMRSKFESMYSQLLTEKASSVMVQPREMPSMSASYQQSAAYQPSQFVAQAQQMGFFQSQNSRNMHYAPNYNPQNNYPSNFR